MDNDVIDEWVNVGNGIAWVSLVHKLGEKAAIQLHCTKMFGRAAAEVIFHFDKDYPDQAKLKLIGKVSKNFI